MGRREVESRGEVFSSTVLDIQAQTSLSYREDPSGSLRQSPLGQRASWIRQTRAQQISWTDTQYLKVNYDLYLTPLDAASAALRLPV